MWTVTDGGYEGSPYGYEAPSLYRIDAETFTVEKQFKFKLGDWPSEVQLNGERDKLYWINKDIWCMDVNADPRAGAPVPRIQRHDLLRTDGKSRQRRGVYRRRHRLPAAGQDIPLFARGRTARRILCRHHPRCVLLEIKKEAI